MNRLKVFIRSPFQIFVLVIPMIYVVIQLFIAYSVIITVVTGDDDEVSKITSIFFSFYFTLFLILGQSFTAGLYGTIPLFEKKNGLRQMMHMSGLTSLQYFGGLFIGDLSLFTATAVVISVALTLFDQIMVTSQIGNFFISYVLFGACLINCSYIFTHIFDNPDTAGKYTALIFTFGLLIGPIAISMIAAAIFGFDDSVSNAISIWYFIDPLLCFVLQLFALCCVDKPYLEDFKINIFKTIEPSTGLYCGVIIAQTIVFGTLNILIDTYMNNRYRKRGGQAGAPPPLLERHQDVIDHENEVRGVAQLQQDDDQSLQIKAIDISKTYPGAQRMAVCGNTFGARKGEIFGLLGPNGAGKSTTFNMIAMQLSITSGQAQLMGHEVNEFPLSTMGKFFGQCN